MRARERDIQTDRERDRERVKVRDRRRARGVVTTTWHKPEIKDNMGHFLWKRFYNGCSMYSQVKACEVKTWSFNMCGRIFNLCAVIKVNTTNKLYKLTVDKIRNKKLHSKQMKVKYFIQNNNIYICSLIAILNKYLNGFTFEKNVSGFQTVQSSLMIEYDHEVLNKFTVWMLFWTYIRENAF